MSLDLTLYELESGLADLIEMREEAGDDAVQLAVIDKALADYAEAAVRKVDGIRGYVKHADMLIEAAKAEAKVQTARAKAWEARRARVLDMCKSVMQGMTWKEGKPKKLEGRTGSITLRGNGGAQAVEAYDVRLIPRTMLKTTVAMPESLWSAICTRHPDIPADHQVKVGNVEPNLSAIAEELAKPCEACKESGVECSSCHGTGKRSVPGARLLPRGESVVIK